MFQIGLKFCATSKIYVSVYFVCGLFFCFVFFPYFLSMQDIRYGCHYNQFQNQYSTFQYQNFKEASIYHGIIEY